MKKLSPKEIKEELDGIEGWEYDGESIFKFFNFTTFTDAIKFVDKIAQIAEEIQHHPSILIDYTRIRLSICTHEINGVSDKDIDFAARVNFI